MTFSHICFHPVYEWLYDILDVRIVCTPRVHRQTMLFQEEIGKELVVWSLFAHICHAWRGQRGSAIVSGEMLTLESNIFVQPDRPRDLDVVVNLELILQHLIARFVDHVRIFAIISLPCIYWAESGTN